MDYFTRNGERITNCSMETYKVSGQLMFHPDDSTEMKILPTFTIQEMGIPEEFKDAFITIDSDSDTEVNIENSKSTCATGNRAQKGDVSNVEVDFDLTETHDRDNEMNGSISSGYLPTINEVIKGSPTFDDCAYVKLIDAHVDDLQSNLTLSSVTNMGNELYFHLAVTIVTPYRYSTLKIP